MIQGVLLDLEGVLYVGGYPLPGAREALLSLRAAGIPMRFVTNITRLTRATLVNRLARMGLEVPLPHLFTPVVAARQYLIARKLTPHLLVHPAIRGEFADLLGPTPGAVLLGDAGPDFTYEALNQCFRLLLDGLPGDPAARPVDYEYRLPFDYARVRVDQGPGGSFSHNDPQNRYAVDFALAEGTPIVAVREGVVMQVESDFDKAGLNREKYGGRANFIRLLHDDGSMAVYAHLQPEGVQVHTGQRVRQGQRIGLSGNTGFSTAPHLHFVLQVNRGMRLESIPFRMFGPLGELKFPISR